MTAQARRPDAGEPYVAELSPLRRRLLVVVMMAGLMSQGVVFSSVPPALASIAASLGGDASARFTAQMLLTIPALGLISGGLLSGWLLRYTGVRLLLLASLIAFGVFGAAPLVLHSPSAMLAARLLVGAAAACLSTACAALVVEALVEADRARIVGYQGACGGGISVAVIYLSGALVEKAGWPSTFAIYAVFAAALLLAALVATPPMPPAPSAERIKGSVADLKPVAGVLALTPLLFLIMGLVTVQLPFLLQANGVRSAVVQSIIIGMFMLGSMSASIGFSAIQRVVGSKNVLLAGGVSLALGLLLVGATPSPLLAGAGAGFVGLTMGVTSPFVWHAVMSGAPEQVRGLALGTVSTAMYLGSLLNPPVMSALQHAVGLPATFVGCGVAVFLVCAGTLIGRRRAPQS